MATKRKQIVAAVADLLDKSKRPADIAPPIFNAVEVDRHTVLRWINSGHLMLVSRAMLEAILEELDR